MQDFLDRLPVDNFAREGGSPMRCCPMTDVQKRFCCRNLQQKPILYDVNEATYGSSFEGRTLKDVKI